MTTGHSFTIAHPDESGAFNYAGHEGRRAKLARMLARGRRISIELERFAAAARGRLATIDREYPEQ